MLWGNSLQVNLEPVYLLFQTTVILTKKFNMILTNSFYYKIQTHGFKTKNSSISSNYIFYVSMLNIFIFYSL